jgi:hypothetical protein
MDSDNGASQEPNIAPLFVGRFEGRAAFEQVIRTAFARAAQEGWREIILSDATFVDWPLRERRVVESLQAWSTSGRRLVMLATGFDEVIRHHDRFVAWRKTWSHLIDCRLCRGMSVADFPSAIWTRDWYMHRLDPQRSNGVCSIDPLRGLQVKESLQERIRNSSPGFPASLLGL